MKKSGYKIREWRLAHGMKQEDLAERAGISVPTLSSTESGRRAPRLSTLQAITNAFGLDDPSDLTKNPPQNLPISETMSDDLARASRIIGALAEIAASDYRRIPLVMRDLRRMREQSRMR